MIARQYSESDRARLESLVDEYGLAAVIELLGSICADKAEDLRAPDTNTWLDWESASRYLNCTVSEHPSVKRVSP